MTKKPPPSQGGIKTLRPKLRDTSAKERKEEEANFVLAYRTKKTDAMSLRRGICQTIAHKNKTWKKISNVFSYALSVVSASNSEIYFFVGEI